jgi:haloalkane dehalogenase
MGAALGVGLIVRRWLEGQRQQNVVGMWEDVPVLRTPQARFVDLPDYPFTSHYLYIDGLRIHYIDEGPRTGPVVLMLHGEPSWSYLYRKMIPIFTAAGYRAIAPDLIGFGKSDKLAEQRAYTYQRHVDWMRTWLQAMELTEVTLICQDWGALIGLRLVAENPERFARVVLANGGLPTGDQDLGKAFERWRAFSQRAPALPIGRILQMGTVSQLSRETLAAYVAPFPNEAYKACARIFPALVPTRPDDPAGPANRKAWKALMRFEKPFLTAFGDSDPVTRGGERAFKRLVPGAKGQPHTTIQEAGHFIQEDQGEQLAQVVIDFMGQTEGGIS